MSQWVLACAEEVTGSHFPPTATPCWMVSTTVWPSSEEAQEDTAVVTTRFNSGSRPRNAWSWRRPQVSQVHADGLVEAAAGHAGSRPAGRSPNRRRLAHHSHAVCFAMVPETKDRDKVLTWADKCVLRPGSRRRFLNPGRHGGMRTRMDGPPRPHSPGPCGPKQRPAGTSWISSRAR